MGGRSKYEIGFITITWDITKKKKTTYSSMFIWKIIFFPTELQNFYWVHVLLLLYTYVRVRQIFHNCLIPLRIALFPA